VQDVLQNLVPIAYAQIKFLIASSSRRKHIYCY